MLEPREKLFLRGERSLSDQELVALLLGSGIRGCSVHELARQLLQRASGLGGLAESSVYRLAEIAGIGPARAARLKAAFELALRSRATAASKGPRVRRGADIDALLRPRLARRERECFFVLLLDVRHRVFREEQVSEGTLLTAPVDPREVYSPAVRHRAAAVVVAHNHPSGDPSPSREDHDVTRRLQVAGEVLGIPLLDHLVLAPESYVSFAEEGWL